MNIYHILYLGILKVFFKKTDTGEYSTSILLSILVGANIIGILNLLEYFGLIKFSLQRNVGIVLGIILVGFNFFYFNFTGRNKKLLAKSKRSKSDDREYTYSISFLLFTIIFFLWTSSLIRK